MKRIFTLLVVCMCTALNTFAQGWPANYGGVMLQGFYWDSYTDSKWTTLESQADELSRYFSLIWVPQSGKCLEATNMGYTPYYYFNQNSSFGTDAELKSMIKTFNDKGIGTIADVVINHHNTSGWFSFPVETYGGQTYQFKSTDIVANDDYDNNNKYSKTAKQATTDGVTLSSNNDEGSDWDGCRDLDHKSSNVQTIIKAYEDFLHNDLGYVGFRYDMVKGFAGSHVADYNTAAGVKYSVGECWDSNETIESWINATKVNGVPQSAAFDFQFRYNVRDAINSGDWSKLNSTYNLMHDANYRQFAVTFVENHDMEWRTSDKQDPLLADTLAANAYMLAMPGTPCVFFKHWINYKKDIKKMIAARKLMGIHNQSTYSNKASNANYYANEVTGTNGKMIVVVGSTPDAYTNSDYKLLLKGKGFRYLVPSSFDLSTWNTKVATIDAELESTYKAPDNRYAMPAVATAQSGNYVYFEGPTSWDQGNKIYVYTWTGSTPGNGEWPGTANAVKIGTNNGNNVYRWTCTGTAPANIIFNAGSSDNQTSDLTFYNSGYYTSNYGYIGNVVQNSEVVTAINEVPSSLNPSTMLRIYNLAGQQVDKSYKGIVIVNGKKVMR